MADIGVCAVVLLGVSLFGAGSVDSAARSFTLPANPYELIERMLSDPSDLVRAGTALSLPREYGFRGPKIARSLAEALHDPSGTVRRAACISLQKLGPEAAVAVQPLSQLLRCEDDTEVLCEALDALRAIQEDAAGALPVLRTLAEDRSAVVAIHVRAAVVAISGRGNGHVRALAERVRDGPRDEAVRAAWVLRELHSPNSELQRLCWKQRALKISRGPY